MFAEILCPNCRTYSCQSFSQVSEKLYYKCQNCRLIFLDRSFLLSPSAEKKRYKLHNNSEDNLGYLNFLAPAKNAVKRYMPKFSEGLDFGCGPEPILSKQLGDLGFRMSYYDPFFFNDVGWRQKKFDFVTSTEVFEHLREPFDTLQDLNSVLKREGILVLMTELYTLERDFSGWYYKNDPTHISFYSKETIEWIAQHWSFKVLELKPRLIVLKKLPKN